MHPIKWIRKNERKIMTVVVILIMVAFVGGSALKQILMRFNPGNKAVANFSPNGQITRNVLNQARSELDVLKVLGIPKMLIGINDVRAELLGQILFGSDSQMSAFISDRLKQKVVQGQLAVRMSDVDEFFGQTVGQSEVYWVLLNAEAKAAGCAIHPEDAKNTLKMIIPQIMPGANAGQVVDYLVNTYHVTEERVMAIFADLLGILSYSRMVTGNEELTIAQIRSIVGRSTEKIDAEFIRIGADSFTAKASQPGNDKLIEQFNLYKDITAGEYSQENPYGFGYKLPAMAALDYLVVKLEDVRGIVQEPTDEEMEEFYRQNRANPGYSRVFQYSVREDPNDPASETVQIRTYSEASQIIKEQLKAERTKSRADMIFNRARELTEAGLVGEDLDQMETEKRKSLAGDYAAAAEALKAEFKVDVYSGRTGMLSLEDFAGAKYLSTLTMQGQSNMPTSLGRLVFSVEELGLVKLGRFDVSRPKMWDNIGPVEDGLGSLVVMVRIVAAQKSAGPAGLEASFSKAGIQLDEAQEQAESYSVKEAVAGDCRVLEAMATAKAGVEELAEMVGEKGWQEGLEQFNSVHFAGQEEAGLEIEKLAGAGRFSLASIESISMLSEDYPETAGNIREKLRDSQLVERLYSLLPAGETDGVNLRKVVEFKPDGCYYLVKDVSRTGIGEQEYYSAKNIAAGQVDITRADSLAIIHFMPENIRKRMGFQAVEIEEEEEDASGEEGSG